MSARISKALNKHSSTTNGWQKTIASLRNTRSKMGLHETATKRRINARQIPNHTSLIERSTLFKYDANGVTNTCKIW